MKPTERLFERSESDSLYSIPKEHYYSYAITIDVCPWKRIQGKRWDKHDNDEQIAMLTREFYNGLMILRLCHVDIDLEHESFFEQTKRGNIHLHGMIYNITPRMADMFRNYIHSVFSYPRTDPQRICYMTPTEVDTKFFEDYSRKDQKNQ